MACELHGLWRVDHVEQNTDVSYGAVEEGAGGRQKHTLPIHFFDHLRTRSYPSILIKKSPAFT